MAKKHQFWLPNCSSQTDFGSKSDQMNQYLHNFLPKLFPLKLILAGPYLEGTDSGMTGTITVTLNNGINGQII